MSDYTEAGYRRVTLDSFVPSPIGAEGPIAFPSLTRQRDTKAIRLGGEYWLELGPLRIPVRAGYFEEELFAAPYPRYGLEYPEATGISVGSGLSLSAGGTEIELDLTWVRSEASREVQYINTFENRRFGIRSVTAFSSDYLATTERFLSSVTVRF